jgi:hypothetical protein
LRRLAGRSHAEEFDAMTERSAMQSLPQRDVV